MRVHGYQPRIPEEPDLLQRIAGICELRVWRQSRDRLIDRDRRRFVVAWAKFSQPDQPADNSEFQLDKDRRSQHDGERATSSASELLEDSPSGHCSDRGSEDSDAAVEQV